VWLFLVLVYVIPNVYNYCLQTVTEMDDRSCRFHRVPDWEKESEFDPCRLTVRGEQALASLGGGASSLTIRHPSVGEAFKDFFLKYCE